MTVAVIILAVVAVGLAAATIMGQQKASRLLGERDDVQHQLEDTAGKLSETAKQRDTARAEASDLESRRSSLEASVKQYDTKLTESNEALRKRTELADAQAMQIDALSGERDELKQQLLEAEERIVTMAARPGVVVGQPGEGVDPVTDDASMLWQLEVSRSERLWRNSVAINPIGDTSPFETTDDPARKAIEIEAAALREDVGALISVEWKADIIEEPSRRLMVVRIAQEMLATASRAPGAARLVVENGADGSGELMMRFESADDGSDVINLIPPQISSDLIDIRNESTVAVKAAAGS